ncbi:hypothetical protein [Streptomyces sp. Je 1-332]|uniref:hypothetical protein n=1 Tax=Streptomyces sp. Je 1-332 TaxID=3231270 RepID=UPI0034594DE5
MRHRRVRNLVLLAAVALSCTALATPASAAEQEAAVNPPPLPHIESLVTEGVSVEGPLINNIGLPTLR